MDDRALRQHGLKVTSARVKILDILEDADEHHLSAEEIFRQLMSREEDVSLATVYRVLTQFEKAGILKRHNFEGGYAVYELEKGEHHDHLVCDKCGKVVEFLDELIEERQLVIAKQEGFDITDHSLTIYGICQSCN